MSAVSFCGFKVAWVWLLQRTTKRSCDAVLVPELVCSSKCTGICVCIALVRFITCLTCLVLSCNPSTEILNTHSKDIFKMICRSASACVKTTWPPFYIVSKLVEIN